MKRYALLLSTFFLVLSPTLGYAHTTLISSDPKPDSVVQSWPDHFTLTFGEPLQTLSGTQINKVSVTNAAAQSLEGATTVQGAVLSVAVAPNSAEGPVLVNYRIAAADGHVLDGEYSFSYKKGVAVAPNSAPQPHHSSKNFALVATSTTLIVLGLLVGIFIYRRNKDQ
jgi:methionine-rich copper-binding protein CopC